MKAIWKQVLDRADKQVVKLPVGAQILDVQIQKGSWCLWYICSVESPLSDRYIAIYGTGSEVETLSGAYIGTIQDGPLVFHVFEVDE